MAEEDVEPTDGEEQAGAAAPEQDVSDLPLDESPEAHIRRAIADTGAGEGEPAAEPESAAEPDPEPEPESEPAGKAEEAAE